MKRKVVALLLSITMVSQMSPVYAMETENDVQGVEQLQQDSLNEGESDRQTEKSEQIQSEEQIKENEESTFSQEEEQSEIETYAEESKVTLDPVTGLSAQGAGKNRVQISWNPVEGAEGYIIYRKVGTGKSQYIMMTSGTSRVDTTAAGSEYNFYFVYPYYTQNGKRIICTQNASYTYAKATLAEAKNVKAEKGGKNKVKLSWNSVSGAEGYIVYKRGADGAFKYTGMTGKLTFMDTKASGSEYNFYKIYPYYKEKGKNVIGTVKGYVYAKAGLSAVTNLKAQNIGKNIKITWGKVKDADGYIIYRKEGEKAFQYLYMKGADAASFVDTKCAGDCYNFYRVYPYYNDDNGKRILGASNSYVYSAVRIDSVTQVQASATGYGELTVSWGKTYGAEGYYILKQTGSGNSVVYDVVEGSNNCQYVDKNASLTETNTYGIMPYLVDGKNQIIVAKVQTTTSPMVAVAGSPKQVTGKEDYSSAYQVMNLVNQERRNAGLNELKMDADLMEAAMQRAAELVFSFSHTRPSGQSCFTVSDKAFGENIAAGYWNADLVMNGWMNSEGHRANILREYYTSIGVGCFWYDGVGYWVQLFGMNDTENAVQPSDRDVTRTVMVFEQRSRSKKQKQTEDGIGLTINKEPEEIESNQEVINVFNLLGDSIR